VSRYEPLRAVVSNIVIPIMKKVKLHDKVFFRVAATAAAMEGEKLSVSHRTMCRKKINKNSYMSMERASGRAAAQGWAAKVGYGF
jgi:hypothetical protein